MRSENRIISCLAELVSIGVGEITARASHAAVCHEAIFCIARGCFSIFSVSRAQAVVNFDRGSLEKIYLLILVMPGLGDKFIDNS